MLSAPVPAGPGEEIVGTFLALAPPDRSRPTVGEAVNLFRHGLRCRLGRPSSRSVVVWEALTATVCGLFTAALAARLAWETARPLPATAEATELFSRMLGQDVSGQVDVDPALFVIYGEPLGWDNLHVLFSPDAGEYQQGRAAVALTGPSNVDHRDLVDSTRAVLHANGWRVYHVIIRLRGDCISCDKSTLPKNAVFAARRGDDILNVEVSLGDLRPLPPKPGVTSLDETYVYVELTRGTPAAVYPVGATGALLGLTFGWLAFGWASRRTEVRGPLLRRFTAVLFGLAIFSWSAPMLLSLLSMLSHQLDGPHPSWHPMWEWLGLPALAPLFALGTGAALVAFAAAALPRRRAEPASDLRSAA